MAVFSSRNLQATFTPLASSSSTPYRPIYLLSNVTRHVRVLLGARMQSHRKASGASLGATTATMLT